MGAEARTLGENNAEAIAEWCGGKAVVQHNALDLTLTSHAVNVLTKNGVERAQLGDTIVCENDGTYRIERVRMGSTQ